MVFRMKQNFHLFLSKTDEDNNNRQHYFFFPFCGTSETCHHDDHGLIIDYLQNSCSLLSPLTIIWGAECKESD